MEIDTILHSNLIYYETNILPYLFKVHTKDSVFVIESSERNFKHLVCGTKVNQKIQNIRPALFYKKVKNNEICLFDLIDKGHYNSYHLANNEIQILDKNLYFEDAFKDIENNTMYYKNTDLYASVGELNYVYLRFTRTSDNKYIYLCITKNSTENHYVFNSIMVSDHPINNLTSNARKIKVTKIEKIKSPGTIEMDNTNKQA